MVVRDGSSSRRDVLFRFHGSVISKKPEPNNETVNVISFCVYNIVIKPDRFHIGYGK